MKTYMAILQMIEHCTDKPEFRGVMIVSSKAQESAIISAISKIMKMYDHTHYFVSKRNEKLHSIIFDNNSYFDIIRLPYNNFCGKRYNEILVDIHVSQTVCNLVILPMLCPYNYGKLIPLETYDFDEITEKLEAFNKENINMTTSVASMAFNYKKLHTCEDEKVYDKPFKTFEKDCKKHLLYKIPGICELTYTKEFVNKTKETFLNIKGEREIPELEYKNSVDIHLKIDTDLYNGYEVDHTEGILIVTLHEIINAEPIFEEFNQFQEKLYD